MNDADRYFEMAMARARDGDLNTAVEAFQQASDRGHAMAAYALAALLKDRGLLAEAETHYRRALASGLPADPPHLVADCETSLGYIRTQLGDDEEAERWYRAADARGYRDATFNLGNLLSRTGRFAEVETLWRRAAAAGSADAAYNLAELVGGRGELEEAERLLRQAMDAGITDAINNLAQVRLQRGDPHEAETLLRRAVAAGDHNAVFNLGIVLNVLGRLDEAEALLRRAAAAGHLEAAAHADRLTAARMAQAVLPPTAPPHATYPAVTTGGAPAAPDKSTVDKAALGVLFAKDSSKADRIHAIRTVGTAAVAGLSAGHSMAQRGRDMLTVRSAQLLSDIAARLPIRTADTLRSQIGGDSETQSQHVIAEAGRLAGLLWTTAAAIPGPPPLMLAIKVILHSAIEIRMIGELYAIHDGGTVRDHGWLGTVLLAWASDRPVAPGGSVATTTTAIAMKIRSVSAATGGQSRVAAIFSRGRDGVDAIVRTGARMHRRMRIHPSTWARPDTDSLATLAHGAAGQVADRIGGKVPQALLSAARDRLSPTAAVAIDETRAPTFSTDPHEALAQARVSHQHAIAAATVPSTSDHVTMRLRAALTAQGRHLADLERRLYGRAMPVPARAPGAITSDAGRLVLQVEDAIDAVEEAGMRSHRLPAWSTRGRAGLVYLITALAISAVPTVALLSSSDAGMVALLLAQCLALPWLSLPVGAIAIGPLFRPWLGGPVPRHPLIGAGIVLGIHVGSGVSATVLGLLL